MKTPHYAISCLTNFKYVQKLGIICDLVTLFGVVELGQQWRRLWPVVLRHQTITLTDVS